MRPESFEEAVELRTSSIRERAECGSGRDSETYCHAVQLNPTDRALPDVVSPNNGGDERTDDPYDTIGSVGTLPRTKDLSSVVPNGTSYSGEDNRGYTVSPSEGDMASSQSLAPYAAWSQLFPTNQPPPSGVTPGWCSRKRVMITGIVILILVLVSALTVTTTLLVTGKSGQTGANSPPSSTKTTSTTVSTAPPTTPPTASKTIVSLSSSTPTTSTSASTSTAPSSISTAAIPTLNSTSPTFITSLSPSTPTTSISPSTATTYVSPSTSTASISPSTTTIVLASSTSPTTTANTPSTNTSPTTSPSTSPSTAASTTTPPTTTSCSVSRKCHSCNSGNVRCPVNGTMAGTDSGQVMPCPCETACFSAVRYSEGNVVHRACTKQYPLWDSASSTNLSCREIGDDYFLCFCRGDLCNTHDMTPYIS